MKRCSPIVAGIAALFLVAGCQSASEHAAEVKAARDAGEKVTVGKVQREIRVGMTNAEVVEVLGSPNMVTTDAQRRENWVYDKISTETVYSQSSGGVSSLILVSICSESRSCRQHRSSHADKGRTSTGLQARAPALTRRRSSACLIQRESRRVELTTVAPRSSAQR